MIWTFLQYITQEMPWEMPLGGRETDEDGLWRFIDAAFASKKSQQVHKYINVLQRWTEFSLLLM